MVKLKPLLLILLFSSILVKAGSLLDAYQNALPGMGYDKLIVLHPDSVYTGGLNIVDEKVGIRGNGAIINLIGSSSIIVTGESNIEIDGCVIIRGTYGIHCDGNINAYISQCTFYENEIAISYMATMGSITVFNTVISNSSHYGFACHESSSRTLSYIDAYQNIDGDYMEFCPG
jgi:hypothetical protein